MTQGLRVRPRAAAFWATRPAPSMTEGLEVFVQEVIQGAVDISKRVKRRYDKD